MKEEHQEVLARIRDQHEDEVLLGEPWSREVTGWLCRAAPGLALLPARAACPSCSQNRESPSFSGSWALLPCCEVSLAWVVGLSCQNSPHAGNFHMHLST